MSINGQSLRERVPLPWSWALAALLFFGAARLLAAPSVPQRTVEAVRQPVRAVPMASWWQPILSPIENSLTSRQAMLRFGAVGMLLGLFIIWYRRP
jgi:hypothetical protein